MARRTLRAGKGREITAQDSDQELAWSVFMKRGDRAHLLTGAFDLFEESPHSRRSQSALLRGLARAVCRSGRFAVTILRGADGGNLAMFAVEHCEDAVRLSRAVRARTAAPFGPWLSHQTFSIDAATYRRIAVDLSAFGGSNGGYRQLH